MDPYTGLPKMPTFTQNAPTQAPGAAGGQMRPPVQRPARTGQPQTGPVRRRKGRQKAAPGMRPQGGGQPPRLPPPAQVPGRPLAPEGEDLGLDWATGRQLGNGGYRRT